MTDEQEAAFRQSRISLLLLNENLRREALSRAKVYREMAEKIERDRQFTTAAAPADLQSANQANIMSTNYFLQRQKGRKTGV